MGICGQFLDAISDEQRDRVIEAKGWSDDFVDCDDHSLRCLVGHAEGWYRGESSGGYRSLDAAAHLKAGSTWERAVNLRGVVAFNQFPALCERFGKARIVALCKARAAKANNLSLLNDTRSKVYKHQREAGLVPMGDGHLYAERQADGDPGYEVKK